MLDIKNISKTFNPGTINAKKAISGLSLHLDSKDFVTIIGSNGAGKSTMFNAIAGTFYVDEGSISLDKKDITFLPEENMALAYLRNTQGTSPFSRISKKDKAFFQEQLSLLGMGLEDRLKHPVGLLSGGQRQALSLLMSTMVPPKLLLLDEHTAALDPGTAEKVLELTKTITSQNHITCLMITHNMKQALELGNRTLLMAGGNIVLDIGGEERSHLTVEDLLTRFKAGTGQALDNDRILLSD